ncbi:MAG: SDR family NAD(P)-dependent oxidoreductase [Woeseiales bacterium]
MAALTGQIAIISGGLGDIGRACAVELARRGADIAVGDIQENDQVERLRDEVEGLGRRFRFDVSDVTDEKQIADWLSIVEEAFGTVTLGVCNAAIVEALDFSRLTAAAWRRHLDVNLTGAFLLANGIAQRLVQQKTPGRIVFLGSWAAESVHTHIPAYCVSKAGLRMLCRSMALEYARHDILINEVAPGIVEAGLSRQLFKEDPGLRDAMVRHVPTGRLQAAGDVARLVVWLCDPENNCMTGTTLQSDGGISLISATERSNT